jgi:hypothetical protein
MSVPLQDNHSSHFRLAQLARLTSITGGHVADLERAGVGHLFTGHAGAVGIARIISWFQTASARSQLRFASKVLVSAHGG